ILRASQTCNCFPRQNCTIPSELLPLIQTLPDGSKELVLQGGSTSILFQVANSSDVIRLDESTYIRMKSLVEAALTRIDGLFKEVSDDKKIDISPVKYGSFLRIL
ncbi:hypothetical protein PMAYCL1PPCAC_14647, partial [Pristionchus mayeri]